MKAEVDNLFVLSESELELELGRRLIETRKQIQQDEIITASELRGRTVDKAELQALPDFARALSHRFLTQFNKQMYLLVCDADEPDNKTLRDAAAHGAEALGYALSGALVASFGWLPGIASVIAVLIAKRFAKSSYQAVCETWKERL
jgi:hypothetical protein